MPGRTVNELEVMTLPLSEAMSWYEPAVLMESVLKSAIPFTNGTVTVPCSVDVGPLAMESVTLEGFGGHQVVVLIQTLPQLRWARCSCARDGCGGKLHEKPVAGLPGIGGCGGENRAIGGCSRKACKSPRWEVPSRLKVATPFTALTLSIPPSVPGPLSAESVTSALEFTKAPPKSAISTVTGGLITPPGTTWDGCCTNTR